MAVRLSLPVVERVTGVVLYEGPSLINGKPIVVIATGLANRKSENEKTGEMVQVWILASGSNPIAANKSGDDEAVCGNCKHRHFRSCYVNLRNGPYTVYEAYQRGAYKRVGLDHATSELFRDQHVRLGAYGDPAAVPLEVWDTVTRVSAGWTGYTHQWRKRRVRPYKRYCMASCDTLREADKAKWLRWRPFLVRQEGDELPPGYFECPASAEAGKRLTCSECRVCKGGTHRWGKGLPSIVAHGPSWKRVYFNHGMKLMRWKEKYVGVFHNLTIRGGKPVG
jgi:hypothetical protein